MWMCMWFIPWCSLSRNSMRLNTMRVYDIQYSPLLDAIGVVIPLCSSSPLLWVCDPSYPYYLMPLVIRAPLCSKYIMPSHPYSLLLLKLNTYRPIGRLVVIFIIRLNLSYLPIIVLIKPILSLNRWNWTLVSGLVNLLANWFFDFTNIRVMLPSLTFSYIKYYWILMCFIF